MRSDREQALQIKPAAEKYNPATKLDAFVAIYIQKCFCQSLLFYMRASGFSHIRPSLVMRSKTGGLAAAK